MSSGRESRMRTILLAATLVLVAFYAAVLTDFGARIGGAFDGLGALAIPLAAIGAFALATLVALRLARRKTAPAQVAPVLDMRDALAAIQSREQLMKALAGLLDGHATAGRQLALHLIDVDGFHKINALLGEAEGDAFLRSVAERLRALVGQPERLARVGDDEFAIIQPETGGARHAEIYVKRIQDTLKDACAQVPRHVRPAASIGVAVAPEHGDTAGKLFHNASLALGAAKSAGGGSFRVFSRDMEMAVEARLRMEKAIGEGLNRSWFELHYQPQYDLRTARLSGFEALVRMNHPERGQLLPGEFLPTAEETGLIQPLGEWIVREAATAAAQWPEHLTLSLNISCGQFRHGDVATAIAGAKSQAGLPASRLCVEISEKTLLAKAEPIAEQLQRLKARGVTIVLDDFGVDSSNLQALARSPCDAVKLDLSLVRRIGEDPTTENIVRGLIGAARSFDLAVLAEGVESADQAHFLMANGCHNVQGFLFGRPVPATEVAAIVARDMRKAFAGEAPKQPVAATAVA
jgi:diguanylate cyclase (GGDEF)-like protein